MGRQESTGTFAGRRCVPRLPATKRRRVFVNHATATAAGPGDWPAKSSARELIWFLPVLGALLYPLFLRSAYGSGRLITGSSGKANSISVILAYVLSLGAAYSVPLSAAL